MISFGVIILIFAIIGCSASNGSNSETSVISFIVGSFLILIGLVDNYERRKKIDLLIDFYKFVSPFAKNQYEQQQNETIINRLNDFRESMSNLTPEAKRVINKEYNRIFKIYYDLIYKNNIRYDRLDDVPLDINYYVLRDMISNAEKNIEELHEMERLLNFLLLISEKFNNAQAAYNEYETWRFFLPDKPKKMHIDALASIVTKTIIDGNDLILFNKLKQVLYDVETDADLRKALRKMFKKILKRLKEAYDKNNDDSVCQILIAVDPSSADQYDKTNKFYQILGLSKDSTAEEIDAAYKKILVSSHPDRGGDLKEWEKINEAYTKIKNK